MSLEEVIRIPYQDKPFRFSGVGHEFLQAFTWSKLVLVSAYE